MSKLALLALLLTTTLACSDDPPNTGGACTADMGCDEGLTCNTAVAGGYCTKACTTPGSTTECPEASVCDTLSGAAMTCARTCATKADCPQVDQECNGTTGSSLKVCKPKE